MTALLTPARLESEARRLWDTHAALAYAHGDYQSFRQAYALKAKRALDAQDAIVDARLSAWGDELQHAQARVAAIRNPGDAVPAPIVERKGARLVLWLYGPVGAAGVTADVVLPFLDEHRDAPGVIVRIASGGGVADDGHRIACALRDFPGRVLAVIDRFAYSAASHIASAAHRVLIRKGATWQAHRCVATHTGHSEDLFARVLTMRAIDQAQLASYRARRRVGQREMFHLLRNETLLTAEEAVAVGVADAVIPALPLPE